MGDNLSKMMPSYYRDGQVGFAFPGWRNIWPFAFHISNKRIYLIRSSQLHVWPSEVAPQFVFLPKVDVAKVSSQSWSDAKPSRCPGKFREWCWKLHPTVGYKQWRGGRLKQIQSHTKLGSAITNNIEGSLGSSQSILVFHIKDPKFFKSKEEFIVLDDNYRTLSTKCRK